MLAPRIPLLGAALILAAPIALVAQQEPVVAPGARVRVTAPSISRERLVGTIAAMGADTCVLEVESRAEPVVLPFTSLTRLEVHRGQQSWGWWKGALIGLFGGAALGGGIVAATTDPDDEYYGFAIIFGAGVGAGPGFLIGAVVGAAVKTDR